MRKIVIGCLGTAAVFLAAAVLLVWVWWFRELPLLDASLSLPSQATLDSTLVMVVTTTNTHTSPLVLDCIDIDDSFLEGFQVLSIQPEPTDTMHTPWGQRSWSFDQTVESSGTLTVRYELKAVQEGHFSGDVDVCNPNQDFRTLVADVVVRKELPNEPSEADGR